MARKAKETKDAAFKRADDLVNAALENEKEAKKQSSMLLQSISK